MLTVNGIDVCYGNLQVLWDVTLEVRDKEILVLIFLDPPALPEGKADGGQVIFISLFLPIP